MFIHAPPFLQMRLSVCSRSLFLLEPVAQVTVPPGPLGVVLDAEVGDRPVVLEIPGVGSAGSEQRFFFNEIVEFRLKIIFHLELIVPEIRFSCSGVGDFPSPILLSGGGVRLFSVCVVCARNSSCLWVVTRTKSWARHNETYLRWYSFDIVDFFVSNNHAL